MNMTVMIVAGALALAAPVGYLAYEDLDGVHFTASAADAGEPAGLTTAAPLGALQLRIAHSGQPIDAAIWVYPVGEERNEDPIVATIVEGEIVWDFELDAALDHAVELITDAVSYEPIGIFDASLSGDGVVSFAECGAVDYLLQTFARDGTTGITVFGAECAPGPLRFVGFEATGVTVAVPAPNCPLDCTIGYSWGGAGRLEFDVPEGATSIDVFAHWDPTTPMTETLSLWLTSQDGCGEGCWVGVAEGEGAGEVRFTYDAPAAGAYGIMTQVTMPAGAAPNQDVWLQALVHMS